MQITGKSRDIITARVKKLCPEIVFKPKSKTVLNDEQARKILDSFMPKFNVEDYPVETKGKTSRMEYVKTGPGYIAEYLKQLSKFLSPEQMREIVLNNPQITGREETLQIEKPKEEQESED